MRCSQACPPSALLDRGGLGLHQDIRPFGPQSKECRACGLAHTQHTSCSYPQLVCAKVLVFRLHLTHTVVITKRGRYYTLRPDLRGG